MKRRMRLFIICMVIGALFSGCGTIAGNLEDNDNTAKNGDTDINYNTDTYVFKAEVMEAGDTLLVAPDPDSQEYKSSDRIAVNLLDCIIKDAEGKEITEEELRVGDIIEITYGGMIAESYPAQLTATAVQVKDHNLLIDGYFAIIDDIWQQDAGLNSDIKVIGVDTSEWTGLTEMEKEIVLAGLKERYGYDIAEGTSEELAEQGLIDKENLYFPEGVLIVISDMNYDKEKSKITYAIMKWRSGDGAIGSDNCTAQYDGTKWEIKYENQWIS